MSCGHFKFHSLHLLFTALTQGLPTACFLVLGLSLISSYFPNCTIISRYKSHQVILLVLFWLSESSPKPMVFGRSLQWVFWGPPPPRIPQLSSPQWYPFSPVNGCWAPASLTCSFSAPYQVAFLAFKVAFASFLVCPRPHFSNWHIVGEINIW